MLVQALAIPFADQAQPWLSWLLAGSAVVILGIAKSGFGSGVGILAVPMFVYAFGSDSAGAIGALLPLLIAADILSVHHHWGTWDKTNLKVLAPGSIVGLLGGGAIMAWLMGGPALWAGDGSAGQIEQAEHRLKMAIGVICLLYVAADQVKARLTPSFQLRAGWATGTAVGLVTGVVSTLAHAGGPVLTMYLLGQHVARQRFIGTAVTYFFASNVIKQAAIYPVLGLTRSDTLWTGLWLVPLVPVGTFVGARLNRLLPERAFRNTILVIVAISGVQLVTGADLIDLFG